MAEVTLKYDANDITIQKMIDEIVSLGAKVVSRESASKKKAKEEDENIVFYEKIERSIKDKANGNVKRFNTPQELFNYIDQTK